MTKVIVFLTITYPHNKTTDAAIFILDDRRDATNVRWQLFVVDFQPEAGADLAEEAIDHMVLEAGQYREFQSIQPT